MSTEKLLDKGETLPSPTTAAGKRRSKLRATLFALGMTVWCGYQGISALSTASQVDVGKGDAAVMAYWDGVASRGLAFDGDRPSTNKHKHGKHKHDKHGHHGHHGHGHRRPRWISPKAAEEIYLGVPSNDSACAASIRYTSEAHPAGSGWDFVTALTVKNDWERELGFRVSGPEEHIYDAGSSDSQARIRDGMGKGGVWIDTYYPVMNTPVSSSVTLLTKPPFHAKLREEYLKGDPTSKLADEVRVFHGLSVSGDVTGKYVYAGYGRKDDFDLLQAKGIDFTGKIAIVKYGGNFRGLKVKAAQEAGAIGCIIFTDPGDDGEITEANGYKQYPDGPARVPSSVQRGSSQFLSMYPGDPTTPGKPAYKNASRIEGGNFPSIPSLPMSYEDAIPILKALKGKGMAAKDLNPSFDGGLGYYGVEYFTGPSDVDLRLVNEVNTRVMPIWNTMAVIPGHIQDEVIIMGNHRDAWVLGAADPNSGTASQYEMVRGLGKLLKKGWRPLRTIVLASWDAEEYGLIGSTEWAEDFGDWLQNNAVAYLNFDSSAAGRNFHGSASPTLALLLRGAAEEVEKGDLPGRSVWEARLDGGDWAAFKGEATTAAGGSGIGALGSGSDYTAFLMRYGVAATDFSFGGGPKDPVYHYHSIYDSHTWMAKFGDPGFHKHAEGAQIIGLITLRLADSLVLPLNTTQYARDMVYYLQKVDEIKSAGKYERLDLGALGEAIDHLGAASSKLDEEKGELVKKLYKLLPPPKRSYWESLKHGFWHSLGLCGRPSAPALQTWETSGGYHPPLPRLPKKKAREVAAILRAIRKVNAKLRVFEQGLLSEKGITDREWYRHKGTSPGKWLGYGATTFPGLTEALTIEHNVTLAQREADELTGMITAMAKRLVA